MKECFAILSNDNSRTPEGFYCQNCVQGLRLKAAMNGELLDFVQVKPESWTFTRCDVCKSDYRD